MSSEQVPPVNPLSLDEQLCFAITVAAREVVAAYRPVLAALGLTHPQYLVMLALWEQDGPALTDLAGRLCLEPATLTPLVKRLERAGLVERRRAVADERRIQVTLTRQGVELRDQALTVPTTMAEKLGLAYRDLSVVNVELRRIIANLQELNS